ncbi:hypothetical protein [Hymenobacter psoromatis]|uniref:hypothetical protein n=1 Tax=Hymenobacter psoromatis TaxID=1484116 RepID=UPI001CBAACE8|nr:hypothetical protein [Hymenobacter psoromatis]
MKRFSSRGVALAALPLLSLAASTLLTGCFDKEDKKSCTPQGGTCATAATVVDLSKTTGCGLVLHLADSSYVVPTGTTWANFHATAGEKVLVGYAGERGGHAIGKKCGVRDSCSAGPLVELGCISVNPTATTTTTAK